jgi:hypothetical protein
LDVTIAIAPDAQVVNNIHCDKANDQSRDNNDNLNKCVHIVLLFFSKIAMDTSSFLSYRDYRFAYEPNRLPALHSWHT